MITARQKIICSILILVTFASLIGTVIATGFSEQYDIAVGLVCPQDIYATRNIVDTVTTQARKEAAKAAVENVYVIDSGKTDTAIENAKETLSEIFTTREKAANAALIIAPTFENTTNLDDTVFSKALRLSESDYQQLSSVVPKVIEKVMNEGVTALQEGKDYYLQLINEYNFKGSMLEIAEDFCEKYISVNETYDSIATEEKREIAQGEVANVSYLKNQIIARRGEIITEAQFAMLTELGFVRGTSGIDIFHTISVILLLILVMALIVIYYITIGKNEINLSPVIVATICSILVIAGAFIIFFAVKGDDKLIYLMPLSLIPALISLLLNANLASVVNVIVACLAGVQTNDLSVALSLVIAGTATGYFFSKVRRRAHLLPATLLSAATYALIYSSIFIDTAKSIPDILAVFSIALAGGFFGGILTIGTIPFWEAIFDVITPMKLGELSNPEHKLLKKMLLNAPGTYHHSLTVANMADSAAAAINANALLARVGAYYHDIGKMENPLYFKENQFAGDNPHDHTEPVESAQILLKHVSDGAHLADTYRLPKAVKDIVLQHHGTTTTSFFLYKAKQENPDIDPMLFTYPGPTPQTKEATIIMLADACEAAVRAMREKGDVDVKKVVDDIVASRISEGQLSSSALTFSDLDNVKASFVKTLEQYFHKRILYPQNEKRL